ncbi:ATP-binding cassette domain-containing protein [Chryseobacterium nematophagum]|uniref:ATP-binding cassette domain-containing protein n=1 Tax=Chryseobacterium nematophagum TaxID=2305228 RepID=A0A3M7TE56_9FLAO|nr:ATP-binding cassette domain-containing protein [Chryseobacterium nematophagum]RMZ59417.1 ATP-binding cassette domain-containing protein [Chryseobacterium nematophagum]RNA61801.1 ATP-binding cassette domain-containing protein [Chryseobacterium nematophagum]
MEKIIEIQDLNFGFSKNKPILKNINLSVPRGSIFGFLGANGAGKSTTMKMLIGAIPDEKNCIKIFNQSVSNLYPGGFNRIGSLIDVAAFYDHLSGWENILAMSKLRELPESECERVLHLVDMWENRHVKMKKCSLGMKQRIAIAITLLGNPDLLILDEPVNGLDPNGMMEIRELLIKLNKEQGVTIFISSHLLQEIEKMITHLAIISHGEIKFSGSVKDLTTLYKHTRMRIGVNNAEHYIKEIPEKNSPNQIDENTLEIVVESKEEIITLVKKMVMADAEIFELKSSVGFEEWFMDIIKN